MSNQCKDCAHHKDAAHHVFGWHMDGCYHPTVDRIGDGYPPSFARDDLIGKCGPSGKLFEPRPAKVGFLQRIFRKRA